ncbi:MAG TPA: YCF48-related protein [Bacteroidales bacterium]|nr:YCF48-related protein [Bacteroidales bacterium]HPM92832.1 YCF48-related protein [Bacteroidales bacterium]
MKTITPILIILFHLSATDWACSQWTCQNPLPQVNTLNDVFFIDPETGWVVGEAGTIMKSTDGGQTYDLLNFQTHLNFSCVKFFDLNNGLIAGDSGIILVSDEGGSNWNRVETGFSADITDIYIINNCISWLSCTNGTIMKSDDFGGSWSIAYDNPLLEFNSLSFADEMHGWAAGKDNTGFPAIVRTCDGGLSWIELDPPFEDQIFDICFADTLVGYASLRDIDYETRLAKTTDGGLSWLFLLDDVFYGEFYDIEFIDAEHGWIAGSSASIPSAWGIFFYTSDGGTTWNPGDITHDYNHRAFNSVYFINEDTGWMVGSLGIILHSNDGGIHWSKSNTGFTGDCHFEDVFFVDDQKGWAVGAGFYPYESGILHTTDGGNSWTPQPALEHMLNSVFFINPLEGWIVGGRSLQEYTTAIYHTNSGGDQWDKQFSENINDGDFSDVFFKDAMHGWAVGSGNNYYPPMNNSLFFYTEDGGENWIDQSAMISHALSSICFTDDETGFISGHKIILRSINGGKSWTEVWNGSHYLRNIFFTDINHGWAIGDSATRYPYRDVIMRTTDGGTTWEEQFPGFGSMKKQLFFTDNSHGWIARDEGDILYTIDGGITWQHMFVNYNWSFGGIFFTDIDNGWVVGGNKTIFHINNGGTVGITEPSAAGGHSPVSAYPNPTTGIVEFRLSNFDCRWISLKIYDLQGQEVATVMDGRWYGSKGVRWDASGLPAGVYFYQLRTKGEGQGAAGKIVKL